MGPVAIIYLITVNNWRVKLKSRLQNSAHHLVHFVEAGIHKIQLKKKVTRYVDIQENTSQQYLDTDHECPKGFLLIAYLI